MATLVIIPVFMIIQNYLFGLEPQLAELSFDRESVRDIARAIVYAFIWGTYMRVSRRVKNTFVND